MQPLLSLLKTPVTGSKTVTERLRDHPELLATLRYHQLVPYIQEAQPVPELHALQVRNLRRAYKLQHAKKYLEGVYAELNIDVRWFKGHTLTDKLYKTPTSRYASDLDVLLADEAAVTVVALQLIKQGWCCVFPHRENLHEQIKNYLGTHKDLPLSHPDFCTVELHYRITAVPVPISCEFEQWLWSSDNNRLSCEELLYLCYHGSVTAYHRLKWLYDVHLYLQAIQHQHSADVIIDYAIATDTLRPLLLSWGLAATVFNTEQPKIITQQINKSPLVRLGMRRVLAHAEKCSGRNPTAAYRLERRLFWYLAHQNKHNRRAVRKSIFHRGIQNLAQQQ